MSRSFVLQSRVPRTEDGFGLTCRLGVGVFNLTLAILAVVFLVVLAPDHPFKWKAARFACFPFAAYGAG